MPGSAEHDICHTAMGVFNGTLKDTPATESLHPPVAIGCKVS
jgi:hypothetical protein